MADEDTTLEIDEGAAEAPSVVQEPEAPGFDWGDFADHDLVKRHGGDPIKMAQSFDSLQTEFHRRGWEERQQQAAPEPVEEPWEPGQGWTAPANVDPVFYGKVAANYQVDPVGTFRELVAGGDDYAIYAEQVYDAFKAQVGDFRAQTIYQQILREQQQAEFEETLSERVDQRVQPLQTEAMLGKVDAGLTLAREAMTPEDWAKFEPYLRTIIPAEGLPAHVVNDPALLKQTLLNLRQWQLFNEQQQLDAAATAPAPAPAPARRGAQAALAGSTASRPDDEDYAARVKRQLKETKIRITD